MIRMENIEKFYPQGVQKYFVLRRITLDIKEGEFVSIMGPSGAGKSTLLHIMGMHDSGWSGEFYFIEQPIHKMSPKQRAETRNRNIGFVFQSYHLLDHLRFTRTSKSRSPTATSRNRIGRGSSETSWTNSRS